MTSVRIEHAPAIVIIVADVVRIVVVVAVVVLLGRDVLFLILILLSRFAFTALEIHFFLDASSHLYMRSCPSDGRMVGP